MSQNVDAVTAALIALVRRGVPADVQELLVYGDPHQGVPPGALAAVVGAVTAWQPIEAAPRDGTEVLLAGKWRPAACPAGDDRMIEIGPNLAEALRVIAVVAAVIFIMWAISRR